MLSPMVKQEKFLSVVSRLQHEQMNIRKCESNFIQPKGFNLQMGKGIPWIGMGRIA